MDGLDDSHTGANLLGSVLWQRLDRPGIELCRLWRNANSYRLEGTVLTLEEGTPAEVRYQVLCNERWETQVARIMLTLEGSTRTVEIRRDGSGRWRRGGEEVREVNGSADIDLSFTPATNTLPIRRLSLQVGQSAAVRATWLRLPHLSVEALDQRYTRLDATRYRYESAGGAFVAELEVDELGLVIRYGEWWRRVETGV